MKKFLISDYDGTFFTDDKSIKYNIEKVKEFRKKGHIFAIATGRSFYDFIKLLKKYKIEYDYLIINHGATILNKNHNLIRNYPIDNKAKNDIKNKFNLIDNQNIFVCKSLESRTSIDEKNITKIHIKCNNQDEQLKFNDIFNTKYKKYVKSYIITGSNNCIEIISAKTNKSIAIKEISKMENIEKNNIYAVGDSFNDLEMLDSFNGFCMNNSEKVVKQRISKICTSVAQVIDKMIGEVNK